MQVLQLALLLFIVHGCISVWLYYPTILRGLTKIQTGKVKFRDLVHAICFLEIHNLISLKNAEITGKIQMVASSSISENVLKLQM